MPAARPKRSYKAGIFVFAAVLLAGLALLKWLDINNQLLKILVISAGLLVAMLLMTYRAFERIAEAARNASQPASASGDNDNRDKP